jgi:hypothetical protein
MANLYRYAKTDTKSQQQRSRREGPAGPMGKQSAAGAGESIPVTFDADTSGSAAALLCRQDEYAAAKVLDLCRAMPPMYVATDDEDEVFLVGGCTSRTQLTHSLKPKPPGFSKATWLQAFATLCEPIE